MRGMKAVSEILLVNKLVRPVVNIAIIHSIKCFLFFIILVLANNIKYNPQSFKISGKNGNVK